MGGIVMSINIGNNNKIKNTTMIENNSAKSANLDLPDKNKNNFATKHSIIISIIISIITGFILMFSFWKNIVNSIENYFK